MPPYQLVLAMVPAYIGFARLNHLRFLEREPPLAGILKVVQLPPQSTFLAMSRGRSRCGWRRRF
jgi:hypothetical protein